MTRVSADRAAGSATGPQLSLLSSCRRTPRTVRLTWRVMKKTTIWKMRALLSRQLSPVAGSESLSPWMRATMTSDPLAQGTGLIESLRSIGKGEVGRLGRRPILFAEPAGLVHDATPSCSLAASVLLQRPSTRTEASPKEDVFSCLIYLLKFGKCMCSRAARAWDKELTRNEVRRCQVLAIVVVMCFVSASGLGGGGDGRGAGHPDSV